jgi:ribosomal protein L37AE/L43A
MENVVRLADYRRRRVGRGARRTPGHDSGAQYYCLRCDCDEFRLYATGMVHCAQCGALMRNLAVCATKTEEAPQ